MDLVKPEGDKAVAVGPLRLTAPKPMPYPNVSPLSHSSAVLPPDFPPRFKRIFLPSFIPAMVEYVTVGFGPFEHAAADSSANESDFAGLGRTGQGGVSRGVKVFGGA